MIVRDPWGERGGGSEGEGEGEGGIKPWLILQEYGCPGAPPDAQTNAVPTDHAGPRGEWQGRYLRSQSCLPASDNFLLQDLCDKLLEIVEIAPPEMKREIVTALPEILEDPQHDDAAQKLK